MAVIRVFVLAHADARRRAAEFLRTCMDGLVVTFKEANRTTGQNAVQWPILEAFAEQLKWPVNGSLVRMTAEEWKDVLSAAFRGESVRLAQGLDGGVVMLGMRTSEMSKKQFSEWLEFLQAVAAERGVVLRREPAETNEVSA